MNKSPPSCETYHKCGSLSLQNGFLSCYNCGMAHNIVATSSLLSILKERQNHQKLSDGKFAKQLGITRTLWQATKTGDRNIGLTLLKAIAQTYPDMDEDILNFLKDSTGET